jgi:16S rRNA (cytosine1402-N4)-methyltransferase
MAEEYIHHTVLLQEAVQALNVKADGVYIDGTYGRGGHSALILAHLNAHGRLLVIDKDPVAIAHAQALAQLDARVHVWHGAFTEYPQALVELGLPARIDGLLLDLGVSSPQLDEANRGFSFMRDGALDMRMDISRGLSAAQWLATASEKEIADVLWQYGEERFSRQIARRIIEVRQVQTLDTTLKLASLIEHVIKKREPGKHPATRSFQAIRIKINQELEHVEQVLASVIKHLAPEGRLVVISFHSLEDRLVKHFIRSLAEPPKLPKGLPVMPNQLQPPLRAIGKALRPSEAEVTQNARARSAIMRVAERV